MSSDDFDDGLVSFSDAADIGFKVAEMAERVRRLHVAVPGAVANWCFEADDVRFAVTVKVAEAEEPK
jgi:hypothetical protein